MVSFVSDTDGKRTKKIKMGFNFKSFRNAAEVFYEKLQPISKSGHTFRDVSENLKLSRLLVSDSITQLGGEEIIGIPTYEFVAVLQLAAIYAAGTLEKLK